MKVFSAIAGELVDPWEESEQTRSLRQVVGRSTTRGPFTSTKLAAPHELLPHLRRAMQLRALLERSGEQEKLALEVLDQLIAGVLIVDGDARVLFANTAAREIAAAGDVLVLMDGTVKPRQREQGDVFRRLVGSAVAGKPGGSLLLGSPARRLPVSALVTPLAGTLAVSLAAQSRLDAAAVFLSDPERQAVTATEHLRALYKLSPTEARVAWLVTRSGSIGRGRQSVGTRVGNRAHTSQAHLCQDRRQSPKRTGAFAGGRNGRSSSVGAIPRSGDTVLQRKGVEVHRDTRSVKVPAHSK